MIIIKANVVGEFRRFRVEENITFHGLCEIFSKILLPDGTEDVNLFLDSFTLKYVDDEEDMVVVSSTTELEEAIRQAKDLNSILRMHITPKQSSERNVPVSGGVKDNVLTVTPTPAPDNLSTPLPELTPEITPEPELTPEITPEPELTPEITPEPELTPEITPEPELTPEPTPEPELAPEPEPDTLEILSLAQQIAFECAKTAAEMSRTCTQMRHDSFPYKQTNDLTSQLVNDCKNLSKQTTQHLGLECDEINEGLKPFHDRIVEACLQASASCLSSLSEQGGILSDVDNVINVINKQYSDDYDSQKKTCDSLRFALDADCNDSVNYTRDQCLSYADSIIATIMAL